MNEIRSSEFSVGGGCDTMPRQDLDRLLPELDMDGVSEGEALEAVEEAVSKELEDLARIAHVPFIDQSRDQTR